MGETANTNQVLQVQTVKGGYILTSYGGRGEAEQEVFMSPGKLIKALRTLIEGDKPAAPEADQA